MGHYRKTGERDKAMESVRAALDLVDRLDYGETISAGTTFVNVATMLSAFGDHEQAMALFERARPIYESSAATRPELLGGLLGVVLLWAALRYHADGLIFFRNMLLRDLVGRVEGGGVLCEHVGNPWYYYLSIELVVVL